MRGLTLILAGLAVALIAGFSTAQTCNTAICKEQGGDKLQVNAGGQVDFENVDGLQLHEIARFTYDVAVDGGEAGSYGLGVSLPAKSILTQCFYRVETQFVDSGSGALALQCEDADNIRAAADITGVAAGAITAGVATGTAANMVDDIAAACEITAVVTGVEQTAGKLTGWCAYVQHD